MNVIAIIFLSSLPPSLPTLPNTTTSSSLIFLGLFLPPCLLFLPPP